MADDDFSTGAELTLSVNQSSLSAARDTIESELGDLEVDVNAIVSGNRSGMQPRDPGSGQFMAIEGVEQRVVNTNDVLDGVAQIETERWELDKRRNDYLEELAETSMLPGGGQQAGGGGGGTTILGGTGLLGGVSLTGAATGLGGLGAIAGAFGANEAVGARSGGEATARGVVQAGLNPSQIGTEIGTQLGQSIGLGLGEDAKQTIEGFGENLEVPEIPALEEQSWPSIPDLAQEQNWPQLPDLGQAFEWPDPPDLNPFDDNEQGGGRQTVRGRFERQMLGTDTQRPDGTMEQNIDLGGITVDVTTEIGNAVDDAVDEVEDTVQREIEDLERRVSDAVGGFF